MRKAEFLGDVSRAAWTVLLNPVLRFAPVILFHQWDIDIICTRLI